LAVVGSVVDVRVPVGSARFGRLRGLLSWVDVAGAPCFVAVWVAVIWLVVGD
jgi:hypothetical protein